MLPDLFENILCKHTGLFIKLTVFQVSEPAQTVRAILCRGASFPPTAPKPIVAELPIRVSTSY